MTAPIDLLTASHEAGHRVAAYLQRSDLHYVSAEPETDKWAGICSWRAGVHGCDACDPLTFVMITFAGPMAERALTSERALRILEELGGTEPALSDEPTAREAAEHLRDEWTYAGGFPADEERARELISEITGSATEAAALTHWLRLRTEALVKSPRFQALHAQLIRVLLTRGHVDGATAAAELRKSEQRFAAGRALVDATTEAAWVA